VVVGFEVTMSSKIFAFAGTVTVAFWVLEDARERDHGRDGRGRSHLYQISWNELSSGWIRVAGTEFGFCQQSWMGRFHCRGFSTFLNGALSWRWSIAIPVVWLFNIWGTLDLLNAYYMGVAQLRDPGLMAAAIYVPALYVPLLLVSHVLIFLLLLNVNSVEQAQ
jgi:hypothetical protein